MKNWRSLKFENFQAALKATSPF